MGVRVGGARVVGGLGGGGEVEQAHSPPTPPPTPPTALAFSTGLPHFGHGFVLAVNQVVVSESSRHLARQARHMAHVAGECGSSPHAVQNSAPHGQAASATASASATSIARPQCGTYRFRGWGGWRGEAWGLAAGSARHAPLALGRARAPPSTHPTPHTATHAGAPPHAAVIVDIALQQGTVVGRQGCGRGGPALGEQCAHHLFVAQCAAPRRGASGAGRRAVRQANG